MSFSLRHPPFLKPGDCLKVVAPSGRLREFEAFEQGLEIWRSRGYRLELTESWNACEGYLAGTDKQRRQSLADAWFDPDCRGILCARGGFGSARLLEKWDWQEDGKATLTPKWTIGFSDITALLWSLATAGISSVHGPVLTTIAAEPPESLQRLFDLVEGRPLAPLKGCGWGGGTACGRLFPANLTVATHLLGTPLQPSLKGAILALEDVSEAPYRLDRMLTHWRMLGALEGVAGIAIGRFSYCDTAVGVSSWTAEEVLRDRLGDLGIPVVSGLPFGHDGQNWALPVGQLARLDGDRGTLEVMNNE
ncbi:LD-carboxypeptidase [Oscillatoria sp. FACHB-1406]|uniref:S66 peptidase family protein n=1 Tax=Oscillatoria sp. FACHB-1406 TaxID=2692846 RepID=UPI001683DC07|nr:LD-carboxypeptidase [Oscillatoria sp. FACHB-1406]MBD2576876.1 LD-carboxypeptidase [Oscillatoria sp. FACHB-1406]